MKYKLNIFAALLLFGSILYAQKTQNKLSKKFELNSQNNLVFNTSHTNIVFETWDKNSVGVEAFIEGNFSPEEGEEILKNWQVTFEEDNGSIIVNSSTNKVTNSAATISATIDNHLEELRRLEPAVAAMLESMDQQFIPEQANALSASAVGYQTKSSSNDERYVAQWESQIREKFYDESSQKKHLPQNNSGSLKQLLDQFGFEMDEMTTQFVEDIDRQQQMIQSNLNSRYGTAVAKKSSVIHKKLSVYLPKDIALKLNVRHGDVKLAERVRNLKASLSHVRLAANIIEGKGTVINASYSPVSINEWNEGKLVLNYVKNCKIQKANTLYLNTDSSNIYIEQLNNKGAIFGSFGMVTIANLGESFSTIDVAVQNSDCKINLPSTAFNLSYTGAQSLMSIPKSLEISTRKNFGNVFVNGYQTTRSTDKMITINAKYSEVILKSK